MYRKIVLAIIPMLTLTGCGRSRESATSDFLPGFFECGIPEPLNDLENREAVKLAFSHAIATNGAVLLIIVPQEEDLPKIRLGDTDTDRFINIARGCTENTFTEVYRVTPPLTVGVIELDGYERSVTITAGRWIISRPRGRTELRVEGGGGWSGGWL